MKLQHNETHHQYWSTVDGPIVCLLCPIRFLSLNKRAEESTAALFTKKQACLNKAVHCCWITVNQTAPQRRIAECKREHRQLYWTACARLSISSALTDIGESSQCRHVKAINLPKKTQHFSGVKSTALIIDAAGFLTSFKWPRVARLALIKVSVQVRRELFSTRRWFRRWLSLREPKPPQNSFVPLVE